MVKTTFFTILNAILLTSLLPALDKDPLLPPPAETPKPVVTPAEPNAMADPFDNWVGLTITPSGGLGLAYRRSWGPWGLGASVGGFSAQVGGSSTQPEMNLVAMGGVRASYRLTNFKFTDENALNLHVLTSAGGLYYQPNLTTQVRPAWVYDVGAGLECEIVFAKRLSLNFEIQQVLGIANEATFGSAYGSLILGGGSFGLRF